MKKRRLLLVVVLMIVGAIGFGARTALNALTQETRPGYTIVWQATDYHSDGKAVLDYTETRYVSATGNWRAVRQYVDVRGKEEMFGEIGRGVFLNRRQKLHYISQYTAPSPLLSRESLRSSVDYLRTDNVLGYEAIVVSSGNRPRTGSEFYRVPALGGLTIKTVMNDQNGNKTVIEPISLVLGEPDASLLKTPSELPVDYEHFKKRTHPNP